MRRRHNPTKWIIQLTLTALATLTVGPTQPGPSLAISIHHCESYPYTVMCERNQTPGGPIGCFDTLCDAAAAGAYKCKRTQGSCEPH